MKAPRTLQLRFINAAIDAHVDEDGSIEMLEHNGREVTGLLHDLGHSDDIQTLVLEAIAQQDNEIAEQLKEQDL